MTHYNNITDFLVAVGFSIDQEQQYFYLYLSTAERMVIPFTELSGHTIESFKTFLQPPPLRFCQVLIDEQWIGSSGATFDSKEKTGMTGEIMTPVVFLSGEEGVELITITWTEPKLKLPQRLSADCSSPYYYPDLRGKVQIFLDGQAVRQCREANALEGYCWLYDLNEQGRKFCKGGVPSMSQHFGKVEIRLKPGVVFHKGRYRWATAEMINKRGDCG